MPDNPIIDAVEDFRALLLRREAAVTRRLITEYATIYVRLQSEIQQLISEISTMPKPTPGKVQRLARYKALMRQIEEEVSRYGTWADVEITGAARVAMADAIGQAKQLTLVGVPEALQPAVSALWNDLPVAAIEALMGFLAPGAPLHDNLVTQLGPAVADGVKNALLEGIALGFNPRKIARIIRDRLGQGLTWAMRTARTAQLWAYREATRASYVANGDIVDGWIWHAQLDSRTCVSCMVQHGSLHDNTEVLNDHHNGRCAMVPVTRSWRDLGFDIDEVDIGIKAGDGRRWLERQPDAVQQRVFGNRALWRAWKDGRVEWDQLSRPTTDGVYGDMLSVPSLKELLGNDAKQYYQ